ncbi:unnamed protein product [Lactuca saligna]|uniref:Uncharacterized protein n=1 Tax=Lactuca saligna TaxID=75948 RepID=A0AA35ZV48_LACSI|nr:unnamed protein product [Lactuca saligna]
MANDLQYAATQVAPYLLAVAGRLCYIGAYLAELAAVKSEHNELVEKVQNLESEKEAFVERLELRDDQFTSKVSRRKSLEVDLALVLQKGVVRVVDRVIKSSEFALRIRRVKAAYVAASVEKGKQVACTQSVGNSPGSSNPDTVAQSIDTMHAAIRAFAETDFMSYLHFGARPS